MQIDLQLDQKLSRLTPINMYMKRLEGNGQPVSVAQILIHRGTQLLGDHCTATSGTLAIKQHELGELSS